MAATITAVAGWSFTAGPSLNVTTANVAYSFQGPVSAHAFEARLYGLRSGDQTKPYFAGYASYSPYDGAVKALTQQLANINDDLYAVEIYDLTAAVTVLSAYFFPQWRILERNPVPAKIERNTFFIDAGVERIYDAKIPKQLSFILPYPPGPGRIWGKWQPNAGQIGISNAVTRFTADIQIAPIFDPTLVHDDIEGHRFNRSWGGIGGFLYVPSFPQLDRKATTFPYAS